MAVGMLAGCGGGKSSIQPGWLIHPMQQKAMKSRNGRCKGCRRNNHYFLAFYGWSQWTGNRYTCQKFNDENEYGITVEAQYQERIWWFSEQIKERTDRKYGCRSGIESMKSVPVLWSESGWTVPMQEMIDADNYDVSEIEPNLAAYYTIDNQLYSMPF